MHPSPIRELLEESGLLLLDGGLASELEVRGHDLDHPLWSARLLAEDPQAIRDAHLAFLEAGAGCIISSSYQATPRGLVEAGASPTLARELLRTSYRLAREACELFADSVEAPERPAPLAAASIGPYGAYLADGSEYRGDYGLDVTQLVDFHRERVELLAELAQLLAVETIPSMHEAEALRRLLGEAGCPPAWVSFSCRDGEHLCDGTPLRSAASLFEDLPTVVAVGVNCTAPQHVASLIRAVHAGAPGKEVVVYPNSGETYLPDTKSWAPAPESLDLPRLVGSWQSAGARLIGGCCRITARELGRIDSALGGASPARGA